jgi:SAM-dependent methyltransferase
MASELDVSTRAALSQGASDEPIYQMVSRAFRDAGVRPGTLVDVGCGQGRLASALAGWFDQYVGVDLVAYDGFPAKPWARFVSADLNKEPYPVESASADVVVSVETIEHLENPRAVVRELVRIAKPGGLVVVTTPNQLSLLSKLTLVLKNQFNSFQEAPGLYPAHITALLEQDLLRIATECGLEGPRIRYSDSGRIPAVARRWPSMLRGRWFSDNLLLMGRRPGGVAP